jgi:hypothetical protein
MGMNIPSQFDFLQHPETRVSSYQTFQIFGVSKKRVNFYLGSSIVKYFLTKLSMGYYSIL